MHSKRAWGRLAVAACLCFAVMAVSAVAGCVRPLPANTVEVRATSLKFVPQTVTIKAGTTVRWVNDDQTSHQPMSDNFDPEKKVPNSFSSKPMDTGGTFDFKFTTPGTYKYHCNVHPYMTGKIIVQ